MGVHAKNIHHYLKRLLKPFSLSSALAFSQILTPALTLIITLTPTQKLTLTLPTTLKVTLTRALSRRLPSPAASVMAALSVHRSVDEAPRQTERRSRLHYAGHQNGWQIPEPCCPSRETPLFCKTGFIFVRRGTC